MADYFGRDQVLKKTALSTTLTKKCPKRIIRKYISIMTITDLNEIC